MKAALLALVERWRREAALYVRFSTDRTRPEDYSACARELEAILARAEEPVCRCGKPPTCFGSYEGRPSEHACDDCCGHGNEDGYCERIARSEEPELKLDCRSSDSTLEHIAGSITSYTEPFRSMARELLWWRNGGRRAEDPEPREGSYYVEDDSSLMPNGVYRIVASASYARMRELGTTARPPYVATVYNAPHARLIARLLNEHVSAEDPEQAARERHRDEAVALLRIVCAGAIDDREPTAEVEATFEARAKEWWNRQREFDVTDRAEGKEPPT